MSTDEQFMVYNAEGLGQAVRHFRERAGLTQSQLAARLGLQRSYLAGLEAGQMTEQTRRIVDLLKELGARIVVKQAEW
jgi:transcriptional regulator with XRE-family HTH domain